MTKTRKDCHAVQYADQMCCGRCGLTWDVNDPEPPACRKEIKIKKRNKRNEKPTLSTPP